MSRSFRNTLLVMLAVAVALSAACRGEKKTKVASEEAQPGRDRQLLSEGIKEMQDGKYVKSRLLFNTLINTYPDSSLLSVTKLALADSFYREGTTSTMNQAEVEYRDWLQFFPKHDLADDVTMKIAEIHMRQVQSPDRDTTQAQLAERQLLKLIRDFPNTELKQRAESQLWEVREILGMHELKVARFYFNQRQAYKATASRTREIIDKYPGFSRSDEALFLLGRSMFEQEDTEEAITYFSRLCKLYPESPYFEESVAYLKQLDAAVPEPAPEADRPKPLKEGPGMVGKVFEVMSRPRLDYIDKDGVLFKKDEKYDAALDRALKFAGDTGAAPTPSASAK
jgi:outer membrane protein assembly factor BamD